jgi:FG-GAP-like repeat
MPTIQRAAASLLLLAATMHAADELAFDGPFVAAAPAWSVAVGDLDLDGLPDLCLAQMDGQLAVRLGLGDGAFADPALHPVGAEYLDQVELVDLDADGHLDALLVAHEYDTPPSVLHVFHGVGDGTLVPQSAWPAQDWTSGMRVVDLQPDGTPDVLLTSDSSHTTQVLLGDGQGGFLPPTDVASSSRNADAADVTGDGLPDVVVGGGLHEVLVLSGDGTGQLLPPVGVSVGVSVAHVALGDLDGDGLADLLVGTSGTMQVLTAAGHLDFTPSQWLDGVPADPTLADLDEDGDLDAVSVWYDSAWIGLNDGAGVLVYEQRYHASEYAQPRAADATGDGDLDLLFAPGQLTEPWGAQLTLLRGRGDGTFTGNLRTLTADPGTLTTGDLDEDGSADLVFEDSYLMLHALGGNGQGHFSETAAVATTISGPLQMGDLDEDGHLDVVTSGFDVLLHRGAGDGSLLAKQTITKTEITLLRQADLDADGDMDFAGFIPSQGRLRSLLNDGTAKFTELAAFTQLGGVRGLCLPDLGGDGWPDAALTVGTSLPGLEGLQVRPGLGNGSFGAPADVGVDGGLADIEAADIDADGDIDLASLNDASNDLLWFRNDGAGNLQPAGPGTPTGPGFSSDLLLADTTRDGVIDGVILRGVAFNDAYQAVLVLAGLADGSFAPPTQTVIDPGYQLEARDVDGDGALDLLSGNGQITLLLNRNGPWDDLGHALAGAHGKPRQVGHGTAQPGTAVSVALHDGARFSVAIQFIGFAEGSVPFKGGVLVPTPDLVNSPLLTDAHGELLLGGVWPASFVTGDALVLQTWIHDDTAPALWSASNALRVTTP